MDGWMGFGVAMPFFSRLFFSFFSALSFLFCVPLLSMLAVCGVLCVCSCSDKFETFFAVLVPTSWGLVPWGVRWLVGNEDGLAAFINAAGNACQYY